jgi:hypothetical protein
VRSHSADTGRLAAEKTAAGHCASRFSAVVKPFRRNERSRDYRRSLGSVSVVERVCEGCGEPLAPLARANQRHHGQACRARAYRRRRGHADPAQGVLAASLSIDQAAVLDAATSEGRLVALIAHAAARPGGWRAAAWMLERRYPERWSARGREELPAAPVARAGDPFAEVDELAERRRSRPLGY